MIKELPINSTSINLNNNNYSIQSSNNMPNQQELINPNNSQSSSLNYANNNNSNSKHKIPKNNFVNENMNANIKSLSNATTKKKSMQDLLNTSVNSINTILNGSKINKLNKKLRSDSTKKKLSGGNNTNSTKMIKYNSAINISVDQYNNINYNHGIKTNSNGNSNEAAQRDDNFAQQAANVTNEGIINNSSKPPNKPINNKNIINKVQDKDWQIIEEIRKISSINMDLNKSIKD